MSNIVIISFIIVFILGWLAHSMIVTSLRTKYPELNNEYGKPIHFWNGPSTWSFWMSFIIQRKFAKRNLDNKTNIWCNILFVSLLYWNIGILVYMIYIYSI